MKIYSWNVNGIRALHKKGELLGLLEKYQPDILCVQETKANPIQLEEELLAPMGYYSYFESADKKGYSGVAIYTRSEPVYVKNMGLEEFDSEGRFLEAKFDDFILINAYFPNSQANGKRLDYKIAFCDSLLEYCNTLISNGENLVICGDYNIAHTEIDLARPEDNEENPGFLPEERAWMTKFLDSGYVDTFRHFNPEKIKYSWWSYRTRARERNIGWRIDYHCVNNNFLPKVKSVDILDSITGSDHCPVLIEIDK
jgi:exodeoxyribonuclease-3